jgi:hypothetical protein
MITGGQETASMTRLMGQNAHLITYGAMSRQPVYLPATAFIFRNLKCHGRIFLYDERCELTVLG